MDDQLETDMEETRAQVVELVGFSLARRPITDYSLKGLRRDAATVAALAQRLSDTAVAAKGASLGEDEL